jgi:hypothetical protein
MTGHAVTMPDHAIETAPEPGARLTVGEAVLVVAGPALLVTGWAVLIASAGQGASDGWFVGHYLLFLANAAWVPIVWLLRRVPGGNTATLADPAMWLAVLGSLSIAGQLAIDMAAWALGLGPEQLRAFFAELRDRPALTLTVHTVGPSLLFAGLFLAAVRLGRRRAETGRSAAFVAIGILVVFVGALLTFSLVILGGYVAVLLGFVGLAWTLARPINGRAR